MLSRPLKDFPTATQYQHQVLCRWRHQMFFGICVFIFFQKTADSTLQRILFLMNWKSCKISENSFSFPAFSDSGGCEAACCRGRVLMVNFLAVIFWNFLLILISLPDGTKTTKETLSVFRQWWSGHILGYARGRFNSLLWIKCLTKLKLAHLF